MKKSVPFDVESAAVSFQPMYWGEGQNEVVVVVAALEIVARYEAACSRRRAPSRSRDDFGRLRCLSLSPFNGHFGRGSNYGEVIFPCW